MTITNNTNISLPLAVWLLNDEYDHVDKKNYFSITGLMKPLKQLILSSRTENKALDISDLIHLRIGAALHDSIEKSWYGNFKDKLKKLNLPKSMIDNIKVNPDTINEGDIPIYMEQRTVVQVGEYSIGGKFDFVSEGVVQDFKSTSTYSFTSGSNDESYKLQLSLYRWLNQGKITEDYGLIHFIFTDWNKFQSETNPNYPKSKIVSKRIELYSIEECQSWIEKRISDINSYWSLDESLIPHCTDEELWRGKTVYKYYNNPNKTDGRSTKNFDSILEANTFKAATLFVSLAFLSCKSTPQQAVKTDQSQSQIEIPKNAKWSDN